MCFSVVAPTGENRMQAQSTSDKFDLSCEKFAALNQVKPQSVRSRICKTGSYFGVVPLKLVNGRLGPVLN